MKEKEKPLLQPDVTIAVLVISIPFIKSLSPFQITRLLGREFLVFWLLESDIEYRSTFSSLIVVTGDSGDS